MLIIYWLSRSCQGQPAAVADWPCWRRGWFAAWISCAALSAPPGPASLESSSPQTSPWCPCGTPCSLCHKHSTFFGVISTSMLVSLAIFWQQTLVLSSSAVPLLFYRKERKNLFLCQSTMMVLPRDCFTDVSCYLLYLLWRHDDCLIISIINVLLVSCYDNNCCNFDLTVTFNSFCDCRKTFAFHK